MKAHIKGDEGISEGIKNLFLCIGNYPGIKTKAISKVLHRPIKTLERQLKQLQELEKIEYKGSRKTGGYYIK